MGFNDNNNDNNNDNKMIWNDIWYDIMILWYINIIIYMIYLKQKLYITIFMDIVKIEIFNLNVKVIWNKWSKLY